MAELSSMVDSLGRNPAAEEKIDFLTNLFNCVSSYVNAGLAIIDEHGLITHLNQKLCDYAGRDKDALTGQFLSSLFSGDKQVLSSLDPQRTVNHLSLNMRCKNGLRKCSVSMRPIFKPSGNVACNLVRIETVGNQAPPRTNSARSPCRECHFPIPRRK